MWIAALVVFEVMLCLIAPRVERIMTVRARVVQPYLDDFSQAREFRAAVGADPRMSRQ